MAATIDDLIIQINRVGEQQKSMAADLNQLRGPMSGAGWKPAAALRKQAEANKDQTWGVKSLGHLAHALVKSAGRPREAPELKEYWGHVAKAAPSGMSEYAGADGGVLVPPAWSSQLLMRVYENGLLARTTMMPTSSNRLVIPAIDEASRADGSRYGGVRHYWEGEADSTPTSKPKLSEVELIPGDLTVLVKATNNLLNDAPALETFINLVAASELSFGVGKAIVRGDGVRKPLGLLAPAGTGRVTVAAEDGQTASTPLLAENIAKMWSRLYQPCMANAVWLMNQALYADLMLMTVGMGASNIPVMLPNQSMAEAPFGSILGRPILPVEFCSARGTEGDIILVDLSQYLTCQVGKLESATSIHFYFDSRETAFRFVLRIDGKPWWKTSLTPFSGDEEQSYCATLATR